MNLKKEINKVIINTLVPFYNSAKVSSVKKVLKCIPLGESNILELTTLINEIAYHNKVSVEEITIASVDEDDYESKLCACFNIQVKLTEKEYLKNLSIKINNSTFNKVYKELIEAGVKRTSSCSSKYKAFGDTSVYEMLKNQNYDRLVDCYCLSFSKPSENEEI